MNADAGQSRPSTTPRIADRLPGVEESNVIVRLADLTREEVAAQAGEAIAVVPIGSTEQHGPHLPMLTDTLLVEAALASALERLDADSTPFVVTPTLPFGYSDHHLFAAALSLRANTLLAVLTDVCDSLVASGFNRIFILNGHGGNVECMSLAVKELVIRHPVTAAACSYWAVGKPDGAPGHAGWFETALMLAVHPELVRGERLAEGPTDPPLFTQRDVAGLDVQGAGEWARVGGVTDDATTATGPEGARVLDSIARNLADALRWFARQDLPS
jgi:creatinine amidohydrolase